MGLHGQGRQGYDTKNDTRHFGRLQRFYLRPGGGVFSRDRTQIGHGQVKIRVFSTIKPLFLRHAGPSRLKNCREDWSLIQS
jgi:hypothetical protein